MNNVRDFGAVGDGVTKDTVAIQRAIDAGGIVFFPPGTYLTGTIYLKSHGGLDLAPGAVLLGSPDKEDYNADDFCPQNRVFVKEKVSGAHLVVAVEQENITIRGGGRIDGNRQAFMPDPLPSDPKYSIYPEWRPGQMIFVCECTNVTICEIELYHAPYWTCFLHGCEQATIYGVRIWNDRRTHNGDGIDIDCCRYVTISDCIIDSGDDCITLRANSKPLKNPKPCEYVTISNCVLSTRCCAFRVGVGNGVIRHCTISNISIFKTRSGIQVISRYSPASEGVQIEDVMFSNIMFECVRPIAVTTDVRGPQPEAGKSIRRISFSHLRGSATQSCFIEGNNPGDVSEITLNNVVFDYSGGEDIQSGEGLIYGEFGVKAASAAFYLVNADDVDFEKVRVNFRTDHPNWRNGLKAINSTKVKTNNCDFGKSVEI